MTEDLCGENFIYTLWKWSQYRILQDSLINHTDAYNTVVSNVLLGVLFRMLAYGPIQQSQPTGCIKPCRFLECNDLNPCHTA